MHRWRDKQIEEESEKNGENADNRKNRERGREKRERNKGVERKARGCSIEHKISIHMFLSSVVPCLQSMKFSNLCSRKASYCPGACHFYVLF